MEVCESIYNLIPVEMHQHAKPPRHKSKYPGTLAPTASTFGACVTSQIGTTNMGGDYDVNSCRKFKRNSATFGPLDGRVNRPEPKKFLKKREKEFKLGQPAKFAYPDEKTRKPKVPDRTELPVMGLVTSKNFIKANLLSSILQEPKKTLPQNESEVQKHAEYGKVPEYLETVKKEVQDEYNYIKEMDSCKETAHAGDVKLLPEEDKQALLRQLKDKWELINHEYQTITHLVKLDTIGKVRRKERYEADLAQLEKDIEKISKKYVLIKI